MPQGLLPIILLPVIFSILSNISLGNPSLNVLNTVSSAIFYNSAEAQRFIPVYFTAGEIPSGYGAKEFDLTNSKLLSFSPVPASATATGTKGDIAYDSEYMYVCTDTNTWKRTALTTW